MSKPGAWESLRGLRILLVEDDPLICLDLQTSLSELEATVLAASDAPSALTLLSASTVDFAVLDFELGPTTSESIAAMAQARHVPFLFLSGYSEHDGRFANWPGIEVLVKPISVITIARHIHQALGKPC